uniref:DHHA2 domain-containing protein n=2 Tax=Photinus pyralis TaxID=7054 RepID=A0A1Y1KW22_PHOPY
MDDFVDFVLNVRKVCASTDLTKTPVHLVIGNESCDLDSMVCAFGLAYYHHQIKNKRSNADQCCTVLPVLNIPMKCFVSRTENCYVLKQFGITETDLLFRDSLDFEAIKNGGQLSVSIVDHHVLRDEDKFLEQSVIEVYDHRPRDPTANWNTNIASLVIEEVGSCATLISQKLLTHDILTGPLAELLHDVIIFDTVAFSDKAQKARELDISVSKQLQQQFGISCIPQHRFDQLWNVHNDISSLTPGQLLFKDLKFVDDFPVAGLPMLVREFLQFSDVHEHLLAFCDETQRATVVVMGLKVVGDEVFRDIAIFSKSDKETRELLVNSLKANLDLGVTEDTVSVPDITYLMQNNVKMSRKQIVPIIKSLRR